MDVLQNVCRLSVFRWIKKHKGTRARISGEFLKIMKSYKLPEILKRNREREIITPGGAF